MGCGMSRYGSIDADACGYQPSKNRHDVAFVDANPSNKPLSKKTDDHDATNAQNSRKSLSTPPRKSVSTLELKENEGSGGKGENEEDGGRLSSYDGQMWLNSPSFRDYCHHDSDSEGHSDNEKDQTSSRGENCDASPEPSEASESKSSKKSRGRTLNRVFPKVSSVKHFLHVPGHNHHHDTKVSDSRDKHGKPVEKVD